MRCLMVLMSATLSVAFAAADATAFASSCARPDALGTARVMTVNAATTPRVGLKHFPQTLPLADKELVLTFDDGPWPGTTPRVLDALKAECVRATFFLLGRNTDAHPALARRAAAEGHTMAHHSYSHPLLGNMPIARAEADIDRGIARDEFALTGTAQREPSTPFFRFPGFVSSQPLLDRLEQRGIVVFGADVWASDWEPMSPEFQLQKLLQRIEHARRGIVLLHDTKQQTAAMLPQLLRELKIRGYRIVHVVPSGSTAFSSEVDTGSRQENAAKQ